jgi:hypothetical protein
MKNTQLNALGAFESLELFDKNGNIVYKFLTNSKGDWSKYTYDEKGNKVTYEDSNGVKMGFDIGHKQNYTSDITGEQYYNETYGDK